MAVVCNRAIGPKHHRERRELHSGVAQRLEPLDVEAFEHGQVLPCKAKFACGSTNASRSTASSSPRCLCSAWVSCCCR
jgi:hypothetical protein